MPSDYHQVTIALADIYSATTRSMFMSIVIVHVQACPRISNANGINHHNGSMTTARRILYFLTEFVWPSSAVRSQRTADGLTTIRRILYFLTEFVWPSNSESATADSRRVDDGQTNSVLFD